MKIILNGISTSGKIIVPGILKGTISGVSREGEGPEVMSVNNHGSNEGELEVRRIFALVYLIAIGVTGLPLNIFALMEAIKVC